MNKEEFNEFIKMDGPDNEILNEMHKFFLEVIKNSKWLETIKKVRSFFVASKDEGNEIYYLKLAHKTQEEYNKRLNNQSKGNIINKIKEILNDPKFSFEGAISQIDNLINGG